VRKLGRQWVCASAIAVLDVALWDLKARLLDVPLAGTNAGGAGQVRERFAQTLPQPRLRRDGSPVRRL
jgi:L-alanine-DL-glutamate epimerase-like enolase superfamily enzyme